MKKTTVIISLLLLLSLCIGCSTEITGNGNAEKQLVSEPSEAAETSAAPEPAAEEAEMTEPETTEPAETESKSVPEEPDQTEKLVFTWETAAFEFSNLTDDIEKSQAPLVAPAGKWVAAEFRITDGKIDSNKATELAKDNISLGQYTPAAVVGNGINIAEDNDGAYVVYVIGSITVFFDVAIDYEPDPADLYVDMNLE